LDCGLAIAEWIVDGGLTDRRWAHETRDVMRRASVVATVVVAVGVLSAQTPGREVRGPALVWAAYPELRAAALQWREVEPRRHGGDRAAGGGRSSRAVAAGCGAAGRAAGGGRGGEDRAVDGAGRGAVAAALRAARAAYGPDDRVALEGALPLEALGRLLGPVTLGAAGFDEEAAPLEWRIELRGERGVTYHLTAEPFGGRVTSLVRTGGGGAVTRRLLVLFVVVLAPAAAFAQSETV
jgi:hypothetical protein